MRVTARGQRLVLHLVKVLRPRFVALARPPPAVVHVLHQRARAPPLVCKLLEKCGLEQEVLQGHDAGSVGDEVHAAAFDATHPARDAFGGVDCGRQKDQLDVRRQHDQRFLPHVPPLSVVYVVHLVHDHSVHVVQAELRREAEGARGAAVLEQQIPQDFSGHDDAGGVGVELEVACHEANAAIAVSGAIRRLELAELLVAQRFDGRREEQPLSLGKAEGNGVVGQRALAAASGHTRHHVFVPVHRAHRPFLEVVQGILVLLDAFAVAPVGRRSVRLHHKELVVDGDGCAPSGSCHLSLFDCTRERGLKLKA